VLRLLDQGIGFVDDDDPPARLEGPIPGLGDDGADGFDLDRPAVARREQHHVGMRAAPDPLARGAGAAGVALEPIAATRRGAIDGLGHRHRHTLLADAGRTREQQGGRERLARDRARQQRHEPAVADDVAEGHLPILDRGRRPAGPLRFGGSKDPQPRGR